MPHSYKNYAHLEGILEDDAVVLATLKQGQIVAFRLAVRDAIRDDNGNRSTRTDVFDVEIGPRNSRFAATLRKGAPVMVDAQIRIYLENRAGIDHKIVKIKADRLRSMDFKQFRKDAPFDSDDAEDVQ